MTTYIGKRTVVPVLRPFPVWRFGAIYGRLTGDYLGEGWWPDWFATVEVKDAI